MNAFGPIVALLVIAGGIWEIVKTRNELKRIAQYQEESRRHIEEQRRTIPATARR